MIENLTAPVLTGYEAAAEDDGFVTVVPDVSVRPVVEETLEQRLLRLCGEIHADNVAAGWWSDLTTGQSILATRNRPEIMMLVVSELSEASEGWVKDVPDDKLEHLPMFDVELADAAIRLLDVIGAEMSLNTVTGIGVNFNLVSSMSSIWNRNDTTQGSLMNVVNYISRGMEYYRKGKRGPFVGEMTKALYATFYLAQHHRIDLFDIIEQKRAYNRQRVDHKPENRRAAGGKAF